MTGGRISMTQLMYVGSDSPAVTEEVGSFLGAEPEHAIRPPTQPRVAFVYRPEMQGVEENSDPNGQTRPHLPRQPSIETVPASESASHMAINRITTQFTDRRMEKLYKTYILWDRAKFTRAIGIGLFLFCVVQILTNPTTNPYVVCGQVLSTCVAVVLFAYSHVVLRRIRALLQLTPQEYSQKGFKLSLRNSTAVLDAISLAMMVSAVYYAFSGRVTNKTFDDAPLSVILTMWCGPVFSNLSFVVILFYDFAVLLSFTILSWGNVDPYLLLYYLLCLGFAGFSGAFTVYNREIDQRIRYMALLKQNGENFKSVLEKSIHLSQHVSSMLVFFRFRNKAIQSQFQRFLESRSILVFRLSVTFQVVANIFVLIPGSPLKMNITYWAYHVKPFILIFLWSFYLVLTFSERHQKYRSKVGVICCLTALALDFSILYRLDIEKSNQYYIYIWRIFEGAATSLCMEFRHLFFLYLCGLAMGAVMVVLGQPFFKIYILGLTVLMFFFGLTVSYQANNCAKAAFFNQVENEQEEHV